MSSPPPQLLCAFKFIDVRYGSDVHKAQCNFRGTSLPPIMEDIHILDSLHSVRVCKNETDCQTPASYLVESTIQIPKSKYAIAIQYKHGVPTKSKIPIQKGQTALPIQKNGEGLIIVDFPIPITPESSIDCRAERWKVTRNWDVLYARGTRATLYPSYWGTAQEVTPTDTPALTCAPMWWWQKHDPWQYRTDRPELPLTWQTIPLISPLLG